MPDLDALRARAAEDPAGVLELLGSADLAGEPDLAYLAAQLLARSGRAAAALDHIELAERGFLGRGDHVAALRCGLGRTDVLGILGRHVDALHSAEEVVARLDGEAVEDDDLVIGALANLGACLEHAGRHRDALGHLDRAVERAGRTGDAVTAAVLQINRSNALNRLARSEEALRSLTWAAAELEAAGETDDLAAVAINAGETACLLGDPTVGLAWFARAEELVDPESDDAVAVLVESARALVSLGAFDEATARAEDALERLAGRPIGWLDGSAWLLLGSARLGQGDRSAAAAAFGTAAAHFAAAENLPAQVHAELEQGVLDGAGAAPRALELLATADPRDWPVQATLIRLRLAELEPDRGRAVEHLRAALDTAAATRLPHLVFRCHHRLGRALVESGDHAGGEAHLEAAVDTVERLRGSLGSEYLLRSFPAATSDALHDLMTIRLAAGRTAEAFALADRARSRAIVDRAGLRATVHASRDPGMAAAEAELDSLYDRLLGVDGSLDLEGRRALDATARTLEAELARRQVDLRGGPSTRSSPVLGVEEPDVVVVLYAEQPDGLGAFVAHGGTVEFVGGLGPSGRWSEELAALHAAGRRSLAVHGARSRDRGVAAGGALDRRLERLGGLVPSRVWTALREGTARELVVVPTGVLHGVPFHAVRRDGCSLVDLAPVSVTPSLAVRQRCVAAAPRPRSLVVGRTAPELPGVAAEAARLGAVLPDCTVLLDDAATIDAVTAAAEGVGCLHLASHGLFRPGAALRSGVRLADGWLTADRVARLDLDGAVVVLSACDTGRSEVLVGDELLGLQRGFLLAGAAAVVVSLWPARDDATVELMVRFHTARVGGRRPAAALRTAQLAVRDSVPDPWWWAPFTVAGAG